MGHPQGDCVTAISQAAQRYNFSTLGRHASMTTTMRFPQPICPPDATGKDATHDDVPKQRGSTYPGIEDDILIRRIAARDPEAFTTLYQRYAPRLAGFLYPRLAQP